MECQGTRSLGTIHPKKIHRVIYEQGVEGPWDYRLWFTDGQGNFYRLKITDLTWHYYCDSLRGEDRDPDKISAELTEQLAGRDVYLRIGLSRGLEEISGSVLFAGQ